MKKLGILLFWGMISSISQLAWGANNLLRLAGFEVYAWDSERKLKVEQLDLTVLDKMKSEFKDNGNNLESVYIKDQEILIFRGENSVVAAFDRKGEILQYSGLLEIKLEGKDQAQIELVDLVKN